MLSFALREWDTIEELRFRPWTQVETLFEVEDDDASPLPYPSLRRIQFQGVWFSSGISTLQRWLTRRDSPVEVSFTDDCQISRKDLERLGFVFT